ncbi:conserved hypothetical protein [Renibacterium salmoninarum ATCC 33209]|uniref:DNA mimic protein DMP19 C-terminal domain-containing protein n=1 Tax=Renibacterium salmoninarum (strain ATCC 33209 / DSM 20767 / JCM 11484 / NBRC 15589 / NCIMB 2235) TaxID=288705 RepID=A9WQV5_RENSM|nr:DUF4375 domain-containing protein [Renibacterium salmoninarum]ABY23628.1 conserved hypothetical protein [Renibacterium salmoninarum ATCC 33209]
MTSIQIKPILSQESLAAENDDVVDSNVSTVNALFDGYLTDTEITKDALRSYYVDFYLTQVFDGGFEQFIFTSDLDEDLLGYIREGLDAMGANEHLALLEKALAVFAELSEDEQQFYLNGDLDDFDDDDEDDDYDDDLEPEGVTVDDQEDDDDEDDEEGPFDDIDEEIAAQNEHADLTELNGTWLRGLDVEVLPADGIGIRVDELSSALPDRDEREAAAAAEAQAQMPDFELIIRELCDVVGYELQDITMGQPDFEYDGGTTFGWHFSTDHGAFVMVEEETEAFMLEPETGKVLAAVEFEDVDDEELENASF